MRQDQCWTTGEEIRLIDGLGCYHEGNPPGLTAREHLTRYIAGANKRTNWKGMDREKIMQHAFARLATL